MVVFKNSVNSKKQSQDGSYIQEEFFLAVGEDGLYIVVARLHLIRLAHQQVVGEVVPHLLLTRLLHLLSAGNI